LELSSGSNGWFRFIANPTAKSQICWSSTNLSHQDLSDKSKELYQRLRHSRDSPLNFQFKLGNWSGRSSEGNILVVSNSQEQGSEISFIPNGFVYFYRNERALVLDSGNISNEDAKVAKQRISDTKGGDAPHDQYRDKCMICTSCFFCTGYGRKCVNCGNTDRSKDAGKACGCGGGQSGCRKCGMCNTCCSSTPSCGSKVRHHLLYRCMMWLISNHGQYCSQITTWSR
jgi:hypothetical protein